MLEFSKPIPVGMDREQNRLAIFDLAPGGGARRYVGPAMGASHIGRGGSRTGAALERLAGARSMARRFAFGPFGCLLHIERESLRAWARWQGQSAPELLDDRGGRSIRQKEPP